MTKPVEYRIMTNGRSFTLQRRSRIMFIRRWRTVNSCEIDPVIPECEAGPQYFISQADAQYWLGVLQDRDIDQQSLKRAWRPADPA